MRTRQRVLGECVGRAGNAGEGGVGVASGVLSHQVAVVSGTGRRAAGGAGSVCWGRRKGGKYTLSLEALARMRPKE